MTASNDGGSRQAAGRRAGRLAESRLPRADVRRHRCTLPPACRPLGRRCRDLRNDREFGARRRKARRAAPARRRGARPQHRAACRLRGALDGGGRAHRRRRGRRHHRHQHGLPGKARDRRAVRLRADARSRSCADPDRRGRRRGRRAGHAEDAARLGRQFAQRAGARAPRRSGRRPPHHGARPHALPVLQGRGRLGRGARREAGRVDPGRGQRRRDRFRARRRGARAIGRRRRDGRPRRATAARGFPAISRIILRPARSAPRRRSASSSRSSPRSTRRC